MYKKIINLPFSEHKELVIIDEYNGAYSLVAGREGKDGKAHMDWCFPQGMDREPKEKAIPTKVKIGDRNSAITIITELAKFFELKIEEDPTKREYDDRPASETDARFSDNAIPF